MPTTEWLNKYEAIKDKLTCKDDLEAHFTEKVIGNMAVDVLDIGTSISPPGRFSPVIRWWNWRTLCRSFNDPRRNLSRKNLRGAQRQYGDRYACVKVEVSQEKPVRYELGMVGNEDLDEELGEDSILALA